MIPVTPHYSPLPSAQSSAGLLQVLLSPGLWGRGQGPKCVSSRSDTSCPSGTPKILSPQFVCWATAQEQQRPAGRPPCWRRPGLLAFLLSWQGGAGPPPWARLHGLPGACLDPSRRGGGLASPGQPLKTAITMTQQIFTEHYPPAVGGRLAVRLPVGWASVSPLGLEYLSGVFIGWKLRDDGENSSPRARSEEGQRWAEAREQHSGVLCTR